MKRVVVIGAGIGGLAAAVRLAAAGAAVTVLEQASVVGGKLGQVQSEGHVFDSGPSLLTMPFALQETFTAAGERMEDHLDLLPVEPLCRYRWTDGTELDTHVDPERTARALDAVQAGAGEAWARLLEQAQRTWEVSYPIFLSEPFGSPLDLARRSGRPIDPRDILAHTTLAQMATGTFDDPRLRQLLERYATYAGADPARAPGTLSVIAYAESAFGAWHPRGGMYRIATALVDVLRAHGGDLRLETAAEAIETHQGEVRAVVVRGGERLPADAVIVNADARTLYDRLLPDAGQRRRLDAAPDSLSGFALMLGIAGRTPGLAHHNIWFPRDYRAEFADVFESHLPPLDPTVYLCNPAATDPTCAPDGDESWFVLVNAPLDGPCDWDREADRYTERLLDRLDALGLDCRRRLRTVVRRTPADLQRQTGAPGGAIYGTASMGPRAAFLRPRNQSPAARGLYLASGSAHPGGGVPLVLLSGRIAATLAIDDLGLQAA